MQQEWNILLQQPVLDWLKTLEQDDLLRVYATLELLSTEGPQLGRPYVDTLQGSKYVNLKELRVQSKLSVFRLFFIFFLNLNRSKTMSVQFKDLMAELPIEQQNKVKLMADEMRMELQLQRIREELEISQQQIAAALNIKQPSVAALEKRGNEIRLSSIKRYVEAMGGVLNLSVELPTGKTVTFHL